MANEQQYDVCACGNRKKVEYPRCFNCGQKEKQANAPEQKVKKDDYSKGMKVGLCHNLTTQFLIGVNAEETIADKADFFWTNYDKVFETFKKKIDEKEG